MQVDEVMTASVAWCREGDDVAEACRIMWDRDCGCVPVVDDAMVPIGVLTDRDVCMAAYTRGARLHELRAEAVMSSPATVVRADAPVGEAAQRMSSARVRRLPVVDDRGRLVGIVSLADLALANARSVSSGPARLDVARTLSAICARPSAAAAE